MKDFQVETLTESVRDEHGQSLLRVTSTRTDDGVMVGQRIDYCAAPSRVPLLKARQYASLIEEDVPLLVVPRHLEAEQTSWRARWGLIIAHITISVLAVLAVSTIHFGWWP